MGMKEGVHGFMATEDEVASEVSDIAWSPQLETGIAILYEQHHRDVDLLNDYIEKVIE